MQRLTAEQWEAVMAAADRAAYGNADPRVVLGLMLAEIRDTIGVEAQCGVAMQPDSTPLESSLQEPTPEHTITVTQRSGNEMKCRAIDITDVRSSGAGTSLRVRGQLVFVKESVAEIKKVVGMNWTADKPTEPGFYWCRTVGMSGGEPVEISDRLWYYDVLAVFYIGVELPGQLENSNCEWYGPLEAPDA